MPGGKKKGAKKSAAIAGEPAPAAALPSRRSALRPLLAWIERAAEEARAPPQHDPAVRGGLAREVRVEWAGDGAGEASRVVANGPI